MKTKEILDWQIEMITDALREKLDKLRYEKLKLEHDEHEISEETNKFLINSLNKEIVSYQTLLNYIEQ